MARFNGQAALDMRQHLGASHSPHPLDQYGSQVTNNSEDLLSPLGHPSPSASIDLSTLNPSFSSNITSEFTSSFFDSNSQNSFGRNVGSATLIPPSQSQSLPPKAVISGALIPADEWSGTTIAGPSTPNTQKARGLQSPQGQGPSGQAAHQSKQQFVYEGRVTSGSQVLQAMGTNQYQEGLSSSQQSGGFEGGNRDALQSYSNEVAQGVTPRSSQVLKRGPQCDVQAMDVTAVKSEYPDFKRVKSEYSRMEGVKTDYTQEAVTQAPLLRSSQDSAYQEGSVHRPTSSNQLSGFGVAPSSSQHSGLEGDVKSNRCVPHLLVGMTQSGSFQSGEINSPQSVYNNGQVNVPQSSQERGQQGQSRAHPNFQGVRQLTQQNNFQGQQSVQSLRNLSLMQGGNFQGDIQPLDGISQQSNFARQSNANHLAHFQQSPSQQSHLHMANANQLSTYQAQQLQAQPQAQAQTQAQALAQAQVHAQAQAEAMSQAHAQAQSANQQEAANQAAIMQARQAQQGVGPQQQLVFHSGQQQQFQSGQAQAFQVANGLPLTGAAQQVMARMQPRMQNQILQGLRLGNRHLMQSSGLGNGSLKGGNLDSGYRSRMPPAIISKCSHIIMLYVQEQRKRPPDNNINFWQKLVHNFFEPGALKRWCISSFNTSPVGRHAQGLFPMDFWFCNLCGVQPGRGFESCTDVLPRLFKIKYDSGLLDELLFLDLAEEYILPSRKMILEYSGAVHESIFAELRVIRYGTLRVTFSPSFKVPRILDQEMKLSEKRLNLQIQAWEFCTKSHEEVVPVKNLREQAQQLENLVMEAEREDFNKSVENLTKHCNAFMTTARQLAVKLDAPMVNDLGFSKRFVRCLQISEVVNSMKDLISFERKTRLGPLQSLAEFPSARKLQQQGLLTNYPSQPSLTALIKHFTQGSSRQSTSHLQQLQGQMTRHPDGQAILANGQQGISQLQGHLVNQLQPGATAQVHRDPNISKTTQFSNHLQSQVRGQVDSQNFGLVQPGQAYGNQMQPPGPLHMSGTSQAHSGNSTPSNGMPCQLQARMTSPGLTQSQAQASAQAHPDGAGGNALSFHGNQAHLQLNHAQALSQLQGQSSLSQVPSSGLSGGRALPNFNEPSQHSFQSLPRQPIPQPTGQVHSQSHSLNNQTMVNGGQQSLPGTPQSEISDLRSIA